MISVIVPVYNTGNRLSRCIESVICQTYKAFELILVDDGSTDNSLAICQQYAKNDKRIKVIHQENSGASSARNTGINESIGSWITFIDSDDYIEPTYLAFFKNDADISLQGIVEDNKVRCFQENYYQSELGHHFFKERHIYGPYCKLYNKNIIRRNNIRFDTRLKAGEDFLFVMDYLCQCKTMHISSAAGYHYCRNSSGSLSTTKYEYCHNRLMFELHIESMNKLLKGSKYEKGIMQNEVWEMFLSFYNNYNKTYKELMLDTFICDTAHQYLTMIDRLMLRSKKMYRFHSHVLYQMRKRGFVKI